MTFLLTSLAILRSDEYDAMKCENPAKVQIRRQTLAGESVSTI